MLHLVIVKWVIFLDVKYVVGPNKKGEKAAFFILMNIRRAIFFCRISNNCALTHYCCSMLLECINFTKIAKYNLEVFGHFDYFWVWFFAKVAILDFENWSKLQISLLQIGQNQYLNNSNGYNNENMHIWSHVSKSKICFGGVHLFWKKCKQMYSSKHILALPTQGQKCLFSEL